MYAGEIMNEFKMEANRFLMRDIVGYYHTEFGGVNYPRNPNFLYKLKNDPHHNWNLQDLRNAVNALYKVLSIDFPEIMRLVGLDSLTVCVVPRAKAENFYRPNQLLFKKTIRAYIHQSNLNFHDGTNFIIRHTNTRTTHLKLPIQGFENDGMMPYPGIAADTCHFSPKINGCDILLVDDVYTKTVNIDEDMVQALFNNGAKSVVFYAIGNTPRNF